MPFLSFLGDPNKVALEKRAPFLYWSIFKILEEAWWVEAEKGLKLASNPAIARSCQQSCFDQRSVWFAFRRASACGRKNIAVSQKPRRHPQYDDEWAHCIGDILFLLLVSIDSLDSLPCYFLLTCLLFLRQLRQPNSSFRPTCTSWHKLPIPQLDQRQTRGENLPGSEANQPQKPMRWKNDLDVA